MPLNIDAKAEVGKWGLTPALSPFMTEIGSSISGSAHHDLCIVLGNCARSTAGGGRVNCDLAPTDALVQNAGRPQRDELFSDQSGRRVCTGEGGG